MASGSEEVAQAEVDDLYVACLAYEDIFNLEITVNYAIPVTVVQGTDDLPTKLASLFLLELAMRDDIVEHLAAIDKLEQHIPVVISPHDISEAADVRMAEEGNNSCFASCANLFRLVCPFFLRSALVAIVRRTTRDNFARNLEEQGG